jgi:phosphate starvation-inducible protein PhoH and related proteins
LTTSTSAASSVRTTSVPGEQAMLGLLGSRDELLKVVEDAFDVDILVRGEDITVTGTDPQPDQVVRVFEQLAALVVGGQQLDPGIVASAIQMVRGEEHPNPAEVLGDEALTHRGRSIRPKTVGQKAYLDAIRTNTVTFGIGPAGTGKTYLAMAMAVLALKRREVSRIVLTRPAVEAGERLGFLPGTLFEKIDPYLRPLFDALHDMMDAANLTTLMERGVIEVAPLAYMRGRAQPVSAQVLTPEGFRPIGELRVGDRVIGSDGRPTAVTGVFPQGEQDVYRLTAQDGSATRCTADHLWSVYTRADRRRGRPARVLQTREMVGRLRAAHAHRYELPLLSAPVQLPAQEVPLDPYALGLLLGDGCVTGSTTPSFATADPELAAALEHAIPDVVLRHRGGPDYVINRRDGARGGLRLENPVTGVLRQLELLGTRSSTKFVPPAYLHNAADVRLAVLQGLLDTDGGPVVQAGRTCRIQYTTTSQQLHDDVRFLVRSLGGIAYSRSRPAAGRVPGFASGRSVPYRADAHVLDIRLPQGVEPFRLARKRDRYAEHGGGGAPKRFVHRIEPDGREDAVCIRVDAPDCLYVTEDLLLTHNTLNDAFIVLDEAQNTTPEQMKMFLTRIGFGSRAVVTGDVTQIDLPGGHKSGLKVVRQILAGIDGIGFAELTGRDVVRHPIVQQIVAAYEAWADPDEAAATASAPQRRRP